MKRYEPNVDSSENFQGMIEDPNGGYVEYDDVKDQLALLDALEKVGVASLGIYHEAHKLLMEQNPTH
jgi:hypothetical protein